MNTPPELSIVIPIYNEKDTLPELHRRLDESIRQIDGSGTHEIVFVNDGSDDGSDQVLMDLQRRDAAVKVVDLSRNFGHQMALTAGVDHAAGNAVVLMDGDLQDEPEFIAHLASPKYAVVSATNLVGLYLPGDPLARFRRMTPDTVLAGSLYVYRLDR